MRRIIKNVLQTAGFDDAIEAENREGALGVLAPEKVDVVITDWNMAVMNGLELGAAMRGTEPLKQTPVLMVTTVAEKEEILKAMLAGANNSAVKPFDAATPKPKIQQVVAG